MKRRTTTLAVVSGKGGVGKSVVAVNLAVTLAAAGHRTALVDADFGQGACALLLNENPAASILDLAQHTAGPESVLHPTAAGITLLQGAAEAGQADGREQALYGTLDGLLRTLRQTHRFVLIDAPAGTEGPVRWALDRADLGLLVLVGEPTAIADAYRLTKLIWKADPSYPLGTVVNFADSAEEAQSIAERFALVTRQFTGIVPNYLGWVPFSPQVRHSVRQQVPAAAAEGPVRTAFQALARMLVDGRQPVLEALLP